MSTDQVYFVDQHGEIISQRGTYNIYSLDLGIGLDFGFTNWYTHTRVTGE